jgi:broad specificity phosphatase PhoE
MNVSAEIWLARHGETAWSLSGQHTGRTDIPLTARGETQAASLGRLLGGKSFGLVLTSPLQRARQTCRIAGYEAVATVEPDLAEWHYGSLEGKTSAEFLAVRPDWDLWRDGPPAGESIEEVAARARRVVARCLAAPGPALLFAHGHLLRILAAIWIDGDPRAMAPRLALSTASLSLLTLEKQTRVIGSWNRVEG